VKATLSQRFDLRLAAVAATIVLAACAPNPADNVPAAQIEGAAVTTGGDIDAGTSPDAAADAAAETDAGGAVDAATGAESYPGAPDVSVPASAPSAPVALTGTIAVQASKVTRTHRLVFQEWTGILDPGQGTPDTAKLTFEAKTASIISDPDNRDMMSERLDKHLKSEDFFDIGVYPTAMFVSSSIVEGGTDGATHTITGDLTVRDVTKTITFPATVVIGDSFVEAKAEFSLNRQDFGVVYPGAPDDLIRDEFVMQIDVQGTF